MGGGSGVLATTAGGFFSGTGFLGGAVTKDFRMYYFRISGDE